MKNKQLWINKNYSISTETIFNKELLNKYINIFWKDVVNQINDDQHILLLLRIQYNTNELVTIGNIQELNKNDKEYLINYLLNIIELKTDTYVSIPIKSIIFSYGARDGKIEDKEIKLNNKENNFQFYHKNKLPISFNIEGYGKLIKQFDNKYIIQTNENSYVIISQIDNDKDKYNLVEFYKNGILLYEWKDIFINENTFERHLGKSIYTYEDNELVLLKVIKPSKYINKIKANRTINNKIITMDIETYKDNNNNLVPYLLCWYDGQNKKSYFINDFNNWDNLILKVMSDLCIRRYKNYKIYLHNLSKFDGIFLVKHLSNISISFTDPIINNGKIITIQFTFNNISLHFRDSYLLLPSSLKSLGKSFNCKINKDIFPILLNDINYVGPVPKFSYFNNNISIDEYLDYASNFFNIEWNFKFNSINYCLIDCISLYEILVKFNNLIFDKFKLNINNYPTLPSLSFGIFRSNYLEENTIPCISGQIYNDIKESYTGGSLDMYIPFNEDLDQIYCYDVNSLYPYSMKSFDMPTGNITYFQGNIRKYDKDAFGFFFCKIATPKDLLHPIIQIHYKTSEGIRTISPLGTFDSMLFSEDMDNAIKYGYKFEIKWGYTFERKNIFINFIDDLYNIRLNYPKSDPMNYIAKILMNSLYGRFGMNDEFNYINIIDKKDYPKFENLNKKYITDVLDLNNTKYLVKFNKDNSSTMLDNGFESHNINIAVASAITSYSRIHMSQFKNNDNYNLFYTDTDSIYINKPLNNELVSDKEIGKLKLEYICNKGIFLAPKVYGLITTDNKEIIKVKGLSKEGIDTLTIDNFEDLLFKDKSLKINQDKWYRSLDTGSITIKDQLYNLKVTSNKRELIYNNKNKLIATKPIILNK